MIDTLAKLVSYKTFPDNLKAIEECFEYISTLFDQHFTKVESKKYDSHPCLVITNKNDKVQSTWLYIHIDVVAADQEQFTLIQDGDRLIGRGVYDMKSALVTYLGLLDPALPKNTGIVVVSDEESGESLSTKGFVDEYIRGGELVVMPDGGSALSVEKGAKGALWLEITAHGKSSHGSRPHLGENAVKKLYETVDGLAHAIDAEDVNVDDSSTTLNLGYIQSKKSINSVPDRADAGVDIRYIDEKIRARTLGFLEKADVSYRIELDSLPFAANLDDQRVIGLIECMNHQLPEPLKMVTSYGGSDAVIFAAAGATPFVYYPNGGGHHGPDEYVFVSSLEAIANGLQQYFRNLTIKG